MEKMEFKDCISYDDSKTYAHDIFDLEVEFATDMTEFMLNIAVDLFIDALQSEEVLMVDIQTLEKTFEKYSGLNIKEYGWVMYNLKFVITQAKVLAVQKWTQMKKQEAEAKTDTQLISLRHRKPEDNAER